MAPDRLIRKSLSRQKMKLRKEVAGSGVLGDLNAHSIDMARFLTGLEITEACGITETFIKERPVPLETSGLSGKAGEEKGAVTVDDASLGMFRFDNGMEKTIEYLRPLIIKGRYEGRGDKLFE
jgi:predicted dehydrogenase